MRNVNVFVDVDLTLVDANGFVLHGAIEGLQKLKERGCHLFLWSSVGVDYAKATAGRLGLTDLFEGFASKPDIIIDDMPGTVLNPFVFNVQEENSWPEMADRILKKHID
jgi:competence transcription factor ComK